MTKVENKNKQNPKLLQYELKDGRASLYLEYYLGRSETPVLDENGKQVYYTSGAMKGKPKYKVKHARKKENLNLYIWLHPRNQQERLQNKNTLALAEKTRYEREQKFLEDREGYKFRKDMSFSFFDYYIEKVSYLSVTENYKESIRMSLRHFKKFLSETPRYNVFSNYIRPDQLTPQMMSDFADYLKARGVRQGPRAIYMRFRKMVKMAFDEEIIRKDPCIGISIKIDKRAITKDILTLDEVGKLISTHYPNENTEVHRAFLMTLFTGIRFCDVKRLTYRNIDYTNKILRFEQHKTLGRSSNNVVTTPLNETLLMLIGKPAEGQSVDSLIFELPAYCTCNATLKTWVKRAGINKHISWHCGRHSFAVNLLRGGANVKTVQTLMGHSDLEMTSRYLHIVDEDKTAAINCLGEIGYEIKYKSDGRTAEEKRRRIENMKGKDPFRKNSNKNLSDNDEISV